MPVGQKIVLGNDVVGDAERMQNQRAGEAGAVLAGRAMDHQRRAVFQQMTKQRTKTVRVMADIVAIGLAHELQRHRRRELAPGEFGA